MGVSISVEGFKPPDEKWLKMKAVWDACKAAGMEPPEEVGKFFEWETPDNAGVRVNLLYFGKPSALAPGVSLWRDKYRDGYEIDVSKLDPNIKIIRVSMG